MSNTTRIPEDLITYQVSVLSQLLARVVNSSVRQELDLSSRQWRLIMTLHGLNRASTSGEISQFSQLDHSQVSRAGYELEKKGLLRYLTDEQDRRRSYLELSKRGKETVIRGLTYSMERQKRLQSTLSAEEFAVFNKIMGKLTNEARAMLAEKKT